ncbi:FkbM family methyltransferase [Frigoriglobus tundricola]|uniref:Methyltransferase FkbM domain-containing protein n=1 Tax=Frigoriglobus tundricola TaxID=2774151 RepID=A0A6M5YVF4_9BACT|nr:FkbM family methyltransferase [Frigoriglobus tundricola]QJW98057.1 hypothetical protein FTUN_5637 [Frigoriglobus tundricola]
MRLPGAVRHYLRYRRVITFRSYLRLRSALIREGTGAIGFLDTIELQLRAPLSAAVRVRPRSNAIFTITEVLLDRVYAAAVGVAKNARTVLDLGANIGLASLYFAGELPAARVFAVEPDAGNFGLLEHNLRSLIAAGRARVRRGAAWDRDTPVAFLRPDAIGHVNAGVVRSVDLIPDPPDPALVCPGYRMSTRVSGSGFDSIDLLKVDIEGAERTLFADHEGWLHRVKLLAIEFHTDSREASNFDEVMNRSGFRILCDDGHTVVAMRTDGAC